MSSDPEAGVCSDNGDATEDNDSDFLPGKAHKPKSKKPSKLSHSTAPSKSAISRVDAVAKKAIRGDHVQVLQASPKELKHPSRKPAMAQRNAGTNDASLWDIGSDSVGDVHSAHEENGKKRTGLGQGKKALSKQPPSRKLASKRSRSRKAPLRKTRFKKSRFGKLQLDGNPEGAMPPPPPKIKDAMQVTTSPPKPSPVAKAILIRKTPFAHSDSTEIATSSKTDFGDKLVKAMMKGEGLDSCSSPAADGSTKNDQFTHLVSQFLAEPSVRSSRKKAAFKVAAIVDENGSPVPKRVRRATPANTIDLTQTEDSLPSASSTDKGYETPKLNEGNTTDVGGVMLPSVVPSEVVTPANNSNFLQESISETPWSDELLLFVNSAKLGDPFADEFAPKKAKGVTEMEDLEDLPPLRSFMDRLKSTEQTSDIGMDTTLVGDEKLWDEESSDERTEDEEFSKSDGGETEDDGSTSGSDDSDQLPSDCLAIGLIINGLVDETVERYAKAKENARAPVPRFDRRASGLLGTFAETCKDDLRHDCRLLRADGLNLRVKMDELRRKVVASQQAIYDSAVENANIEAEIEGVRQRLEDFGHQWDID